MINISYYHSLLRKYVIVFGTLFNNIRIEHENADGTIQQKFKVPIAYGPREKFLARLETNPDANSKYAIRLPRMAFEITNIQYAPSRKLQTIQKIYNQTTTDGRDTIKKIYAPVPYDISFNLYIMTKSTEDSTRIVEQILPYFTPEWTVSARLLEDWDFYTDIPVVINNLSYEDTYEQSYLQRRAIIYTINFTMKGYLFGPTTPSKLIKISTVNLRNPIDIDNFDIENPDDILSTIEVKPGLDANGNPTTIDANSISHLSIDSDDNYGYIITKTDSSVWKKIK